MKNTKQIGWLLKYIYDIFCLKYSHFKDELDYDFFNFLIYRMLFARIFLPVPATYIFYNAE